MNKEFNTLKMFSLVPNNSPVGLVMRHSARYPILHPKLVDYAGLTAFGVKLAQEFGKQISIIRQPGRLMVSYVGRCQDTAKAIVKGAGWKSCPVVEKRLSYLYPAWCEEPDPLASTDKLSFAAAEAARFFMSGNGHGENVDVFVTHDTILNSLAAYLLGEKITRSSWPEYLEGMLFWKNKERSYLAWRGKTWDITSKLDGDC